MIRFFNKNIFEFFERKKGKDFWKKNLVNIIKKNRLIFKELTFKLLIIIITYEPRCGIHI